jgi:Protein of unknown function (DUF5674)
MAIILVDRPISRQELKAAAEPYFEEVVKAVVDVEKRVMAIGGELHSDEEAFLLEQNSRQQNLWGINLLLEFDISEMVEFDSMINIRPAQDNRSRGIENETLRERIIEIVNELVS